MTRRAWIITLLTVVTLTIASYAHGDPFLSFGVSRVAQPSVARLAEACRLSARHARSGVHEISCSQVVRTNLIRAML
jgi:hypothetical protein